jgi:hypothetical protein
MTGTTNRKKLAMAVAVAALGVLIATQIASATHPRPKSASPIRVSLVPSYEQCTAPNRTHGPPLAFPSCSPPVQTSDYVTVGTPDANGAAANSAGYFLLKVVPHTCCPPQDAVVKAEITDVRCKPGTSANVCSSANAIGGPDYAGELRTNATIRITDHYNATSPGGGTDPATVIDIPFPVNMFCTSTADTSIGGTCNVTAGPVAVGPPSSSVPARAVVEVTQLEVFDGGADGQAATAGNTLFAVQGIFIP